MTYEDFNRFVANSALNHGLLYYSIFSIISLILGYYAGTLMWQEVSINQKTIRIPRPWTTLAMLVLVELTTLSLFLAFAAIVGRFPMSLWLIAALGAVAGALSQQIILWTARGKDFYNLQVQYLVAQGVEATRQKSALMLGGFAFIITSLFTIGVLFYVAFLYDAKNIGNIDYESNIAFWLFLIPTAAPLIPIFLASPVVLASEYTTQGARNLALTNTASTVLVSTIFIIGMLLIYPKASPWLADRIAYVPFGILGTVVLVLLTAYWRGEVSYRRLVNDLRETIDGTVKRLAVLVDRPDDQLRRQEEGKLFSDVMNAAIQQLKDGGTALYYLGLKLFSSFTEAQTQIGASRRQALLQQIGFGAGGAFAGNPKAEIDQACSQIASDVGSQYNPFLQNYIRLVDVERVDVEKAHPVVSNIARLLTIGGVILDETDNRKDVLSDLASDDATKVDKSNFAPAWSFSILNLLIYPILGAFGTEVLTKLKEASQTAGGHAGDWIIQLITKSLGN